MTSTAVFSSLQAPAPEDTMDMSSPANAMYDEDIDIDFGDVEDSTGVDAGGVPLPDDEHMDEDAEQEPTEAVADDLMEDDAQPAEAAVQEQEMQDGLDQAAYEQGDPDEELIDYGPDELDDDTQIHYQDPAESVPDVYIADQEPADGNFEQVDEEIVREPEVSGLQQTPVLVEQTFLPREDSAAAPEALQPAAIDATFSVSADGEAFPDGDTPLQANAATDGASAEDGQQASALSVDAQAAGVLSAEEPGPTFDDPTDHPAHANSVESPIQHASASKGELGIQVPAQLVHAASFDADVPGTPTDTGLHPVNVQFNGWEWPLFRSKYQPDGLLKDDNLASVGLAELLANCRQRISLKTGEMISDDQEATLSFDSMGMEVSENHPACFSTSLSEVLDVYKQLCTNELSSDDGVDQIPALTITLFLHVKFASQLAGLKNAASAGLGLSQCSPEFFDVDEEEWIEGDDTYNEEEHEGNVGFGQQGMEDHVNPAQPGSATAEQFYPTDEISYGVDEESGQFGIGKETAQDHSQDQSNGHNESAANVAVFESAEGPGDTEDQDATAQVDLDQEADHNAVHEGYDAEAKAVPEAEADDQSGALQVTAVASGDFEASREQEVIKVASGASSTTLRADDANVADELGQDEHDDVSTLYDVSFNGDLEGQQPEDAQDLVASAVGDTDADVDTETHANTAVAGHASPTHSEKQDQDFIEYSAAKLDEPAPSPEDLDQRSQGRQASAEGDAHEGETHEYLQETYPVQDQIDYTEDAEPEASHDTVEGESFEHGPEQDINGDAVDLNNTDTIDKHDTRPDIGAAGTPDIDDEESIDFDSDTEEQHEARKAAEQGVAAKTPGSPLGKRSIDETEAATQDGEPEHKKPRSS